MAAATSLLVSGPTWSDAGSATYPGRFPLSVERHVMSMVDRLVPGVTTATLNARYYALHGLVASEARRNDLTEAEAVALTRRAEVVIGAVSARHLRLDENAHRGLRRPHGMELIAPKIDGGIDIGALSAPNAYAQPAWGFFAAYRASEAVLQIIKPRGLEPGEQLDHDAVAAGLGDALQLASRSTLTADDLDASAHLCICRSATSPDGAWLARLLAQPGLSQERQTRAGTRRQTLRMLARCTQLTRVEHASDDVSEFLAYGSAATEDAVLAGIPAVARWRGLILRNHSVWAWRELWAWLVNEGINGLTARAELGDKFAGALEPQSVRAFAGQLPATTGPGGHPLPAELDPGLRQADWPVWSLGILLLGARRSGELTETQLDGFHGRDREDVSEELSPAWLAGRTDEWRDRPVRDFARWLAEVMLNRSQRLAWRKAQPDRKTGEVRIPTRVYLRDGFVVRDSDETGGATSLRLDQLAGVLAGAGLLAVENGRWTAGPRGDLLA
jgi:hypothetical protein